MALSAFVSQDSISKLEHEPTMVLEAAMELVTSQLQEPLKPLPLVSTAKFTEINETIVSEVEYTAVVPPPADEVDNGLQLNAVVAGVLEPASGAKKLRKMLLETNELIVCPGVYDGLSARTAMELGFSAMYMVRDEYSNTGYPAESGLSNSLILIQYFKTGAGTTASRIGQPDLAIAQLHEMRENAEMIANLDPFGPPLIADMDTGYGGMSSDLSKNLYIDKTWIGPALTGSNIGPIMVARTVEQYIRAGVAGAHLEDQVRAI